MVGFILLPLVVVTVDVHLCKCGRGIVPGFSGIIPETAYGLCHGAGMVEGFHLFRQHPVNGQSRRVGPLLDLIADTPYDHRRMIAVTQYHCFNILFPPFIEKPVVILRIFGFLPVVKGFVHHEHPQRVTGIKEMARWRVVGGADGIEAGFLHGFHPPEFSRPEGRGSQRTVIMVKATPFQQNRFPV